MRALAIYPVSGAGWWLRPTISAVLFLVAGVLAAIDARAGSRHTTLENAGTACFQRGDEGLTADFRPDFGCLSSSCTRRLEQTFTVVVDTGRREIAMTSRFTIATADGSGPCTADCGGGGWAMAKLPDLPAGEYRVILGGEDIGGLDTAAIADRPTEGTCFTRPAPR